LTTLQAKGEIDRILGAFQLIPETAAIFDAWQDLVVSYAVSGHITHDARLVAAMKSFGIENISTFNEKDFRRFTEIKIPTPQSIGLADKHPCNVNAISASHSLVSLLYSHTKLQGQTRMALKLSLCFLGVYFSDCGCGVGNL
jgi:hypothetical protein